ncbi:MAG: tRNA 2-thiouridine(34) synthase MnmA [Candidatus Omnitrophota bacterium]
MIKKAKKKRILVALSGGVDSSCAAALLKEEGHEIIAVTFKMWPKEECGTVSRKACCSLEAIVRARSVAEKLGIPYYVIDYSKEFKKYVIDYFCREYQRGHTPNPCVLCNEKIKFGYLLKKAQALGADYVASGHYARVRFDRATGRYALRESSEKGHDQSYFLFSIKQEQLEKIIFPLEEISKRQVRKIAKKYGLMTHDVESSQDICFSQDIPYAEYLDKKRGIRQIAGDIVDKDGKVLGRHKGICRYTIGQRRGLGIAHKEPLYVTAIDPKNNRIVVGEKHEVMKTSFIVERMNWVSVSGITKPIDADVKIRYRHVRAPASIMPAGERRVRVDFKEPQEAPTPGQAAVMYVRDEVLGGGWIKEVIR